MSDKYYGINVAGIYVYMFHENMKQYIPYIDEPDRLTSFEDLLKYCIGHNIKMECDVPRNIFGIKPYKAIRKKLLSHPEIMMTKQQVIAMVNLAEA